MGTKGQRNLTAELREEIRAIIIKRKAEGLSYVQIAKRLGMTYTCVPGIVRGPRPKNAPGSTAAGEDGMVQDDL